MEKSDIITEICSRIRLIDIFPESTIKSKLLDQDLVSTEQYCNLFSSIIYDNNFRNEINKSIIKSINSYRAYFSSGIYRNKRLINMDDAEFIMFIEKTEKLTNEILHHLFGEIVSDDFPK